MAARLKSEYLIPRFNHSQFPDQNILQKKKMGAIVMFSDISFQNQMNNRRQLKQIIKIILHTSKDSRWILKTNLILSNKSAEPSKLHR